MSRNKGKNATGGARKAARHEVYERRAGYDAPPSLLALLRAIWAKRDRLEPREREMVQSFLQRLRSGPLSEAQTHAAKRIGTAYGVGYDDPTFDDGPEIAPTKPGGPRVERWGALPAKPPARRVASS